MPGLYTHPMYVLYNSNSAETHITSKVLKLSGIGPAEELKKHGIPVVLDLPGVGSNLLDHPCIHLSFKDSQGLSLSYLLSSNVSEAVRTMFSVFRYLVGFGGPIATNVGLLREVSARTESFVTVRRGGCIHKVRPPRRISTSTIPRATSRFYFWSARA